LFNHRTRAQHWSEHFGSLRRDRFVHYIGLYLTDTENWHPNFTWGLTLFLVLVLPSVFGALDLVTDMIFISWGTTGLREDFRWVLIRS